MSGVLNVASRALVANQVVLSTAGHNIANVATPGYSRQNVALESAAGQYTGSGYIGKGVNVSTIERSYSDFLTRQANAATAVSSGDNNRITKLNQLQDIFQGGESGLGASVNAMLNAFSDVATAPTDLTARSVALTNADEVTRRLRQSADRLTELQYSVKTEIGDKVTKVNSLAQQMASLNDEISRSMSGGQPPNDLLDTRDRVLREINQYVQVSAVPSNDGTLSLFVAGSQALVLGASAMKLVASNDDFNDPSRSKLSVLKTDGTLATLNTAMLGGGELPSLLKFQNEDMAEAANLLGRLALTTATVMNEQHRLGRDLDNNPGGDLFNVQGFSTPLAASTNTGTGTITIDPNFSPTLLKASEYEVTFTNGSDGVITRLADGATMAFSGTPVTLDFDPANPDVDDGLTIDIGGGPAAGDRFVIKPFSGVADNITTVFSSPRELAVGNPIEPVVTSTNLGSLTASKLSVAPGFVMPTPPVVITFTGPNTYTLSGGVTNMPAGGPNYTYTPGSPITVDGWSLTVKGTPGTVTPPTPEDTIVVQEATATYVSRNAGNADSLMALRDMAAFDGAALSDGYANLMGQTGIRVQSAKFAAEVSSAIATNIEKDRASVSGVNLDEEAAKLMQFQQAYQASAKLLQVAQSMFDQLIRGLSS